MKCHLKLHIDITLQYDHRRDRPTRPVGRVPSNFGDHGDQVYFSPLQLLQLAAVFRCALWEAYNASTDPLSQFKGRKKEENEREWVETWVEQ